MGETRMYVELIACTQLTDKFRERVSKHIQQATDGQVVALTAIRTCYSPNKPTEIIEKEGSKYFGQRATDGKEGTDAERLFRQIVASKHTSTLEGISFTFAIEGISRACLAQLTRHRVGFSYSVQSQRHVKFGSGDKTGGFGYVIPDSIQNRKDDYEKLTFEYAMTIAQQYYDRLREAGVPAEDARMVLPQAAATNLVMTANLRALLDFYAKRRKGSGAQAEIAELAERFRKEVVEVEPWLDPFFERAKY